MLTLHQALELRQNSEGKTDVNCLELCVISALGDSVSDSVGLQESRLMNWFIYRSSHLAYVALHHHNPVSQLTIHLSAVSQRETSRVYAATADGLRPLKNASARYAQYVP